jgi:NAD(P)-dependent dehydrogenase (short-subunit alcohol dehydrogenase family)
MNRRKIILITGASSGMGKATALDLIKAGHTVYAAARSVDKMADIERAGGHVLQLDVSKEAEAATAVNRVISEQGRIDVVWNNAGFGLYGPVEEIAIDKARYQFEVNLFGLAAVTQAALPHMRAQKSGLIVNTSSMGGKIYSPLGAWYHATKHALEGWSDCLRLEVKEFGIDVVVLEPGGVDTGFSSGVLRHFAPEADRGPYQRMVRSLVTTMQSGSIRLSDPSLISKTMQSIIAAKRPKIRYLVGAMAKPLVGIRKLFGDRFFDRLILSMLK